jgi:hypothetical protein
MVRLGNSAQFGSVYGGGKRLGRRSSPEQR